MTRRPSIADPSNPPASTYTDGQHPEELARAGNYDPRAWNDTCPTCGGPALTTEYQVRSGDERDFRTVKKTTCRRSMYRRLWGEKPRCPEVKL